jgi:hypothetical protein
VRKTVEAMSTVSRKLAAAKELSKSSPDLYGDLREIFNDCQEILAIHCDCPPIWLIAGRVEDIVKNMEHSRKQPV